MLTTRSLLAAVGPATFCACALAAGACDSRLVLGDSPDAAGAAGHGGSMLSGAAGDGIAGTTGTAGTMGGVGGSAGTGGPGVTPLPISANEALARLAIVLWNDTPDGALLAKAAGGQIATVGDLHPVIQEMLVDVRATAGVGAFYRWWLNLPALAQASKDASLFPVYTPALQADMAFETESFGVNVTLGLGGSYRTLMTAGFSFIDARLAAIYGVTGVTGDSFQQVDLPAGQRAGLLTQPALQALGSIATRNSPSLRGNFILERFLCSDVGVPPPNLATLPLDTPAPGITLRQALETNVQQEAACTGCHQLLDPFGLAFEGFDAIGRARTMDNGASVDVSNLRVLAGPSAGPTVVDGPIELASLLADNPTAQDCMTRKWLSFVLGRDLQAADDAWVAQIDATFSAAGYNLKELIAAVLMSGPFLAP